jgi:hypothetical protein
MYLIDNDRYNDIVNQIFETPLHVYQKKIVFKNHHKHSKYLLSVWLQVLYL